MAKVSKTICVVRLNDWDWYHMVKILILNSHRRRSYPGGHSGAYRRRVGNQRGDSSKDHDQKPKPNQHHQRVQVNFDDGPASVLVKTFINDIKIFLDRGTVSDHRGGLLTSPVKATLRIHRSQRLAIFVNVNDGPFAFVIRFRVLGIRAAN